MTGPCAKQTVTATIVTPDGQRFVGSNWCATPQKVCPRGDAPTGVDYWKCKDICHQHGHAEIDALRLAGTTAKGAHMYLEGHYYACESCLSAAQAAGIVAVTIGAPP